MHSRPLTRPSPVTTPAPGAPPNSAYIPCAAQSPNSVTPALIQQQRQPLPNCQSTFCPLGLGCFGAASLPDSLFLILHLQQKLYERSPIRPETHRSDVHLRVQPIRRLHFILHRVFRPQNFCDLFKTFFLLNLHPQRARRVAFTGPILKRARIPPRTQNAVFQTRFCPDFHSKPGAGTVILLTRRLLFLLT